MKATKRRSLILLHLLCYHDLCLITSFKIKGDQLAQIQQIGVLKEKIVAISKEKYGEDKKRYNH